MNLNITEDLVHKLNNAVKYWNQNFYNDDMSASLSEKYFDTWCKEAYGLEVKIVENNTLAGQKYLSLAGGEIIDDEKYTWFLLTF